MDSNFHEMETERSRKGIARDSPSPSRVEVDGEVDEIDKFFMGAVGSSSAVVDVAMKEIWSGGRVCLEKSVLATNEKKRIAGAHASGFR